MGEVRLVPVRFGDAGGFTDMWHRHHRRPTGHVFSMGVANELDVLVGVACVGRPVAVAYQDGLTLEVNRTTSDGTRNVNSMLYGAAWRAAKALGYRRLITYTQEGESGASLRGAGWRIVAQLPARGSWKSPSRPNGSDDHGGIPRTLWEAVS